MFDHDIDTDMRMAAFEHVRMLGEIHDNLTATELKPGFLFRGDRIPFVNPQRGIFKPMQLRFGHGAMSDLSPQCAAKRKIACSGNVEGLG
jgi:hypothetical protein